MPCASAMRRIHLSDLIVMDVARACPATSRDTRSGGGSRVLDDYVGKLRREILGLLRDENRDLARNRLVRVRDGAVRVGHDRRASRVRLLADVDVERQAAPERHL